MFPARWGDQEGMGLDSSRLRLRVQVVTAGVWVTYMTCAAIAGWAVATWDRPYRELTLAIVCVAVVSAFVVSRLPAEQIVRSRYREAFFLIWSLLDVALVCTLAYLDVGITSPATLMLFLMLVFSALSYPLASMIVVVAASVIGVAVLGVVGGVAHEAFEPDAPYVAMFLVSMAMTGVLCVWQTRLGERQRDELAELSRTDPLTGCLNRRGFAERLDAELARSEREGTEVALVQLDLNGFKQVNDRHGHAAGDELLRWVASTMKGLLRESDSIGRLGGDEFALLLPGIPVEEARDVAARTVAALGERIGAAAGVACHSADGGDGDELLKHADADLYAAKAHG
jgi:diguanylate cyclase (GGDEF)-like protein